MTIKLHYSEALIRRAIKAFWWRTTGWSFFVALLLTAGGGGLLYLRGDRSWVVGATGALAILGVGMAAMLYFTHYRGSLGRFRRMKMPEGELKLEEDHFQISSDVGRSEMRWDVVTELWRFPEFWLLFLSRSQFVTLPAADLDEASREFILGKLGSLKAKVR